MLIAAIMTAATLASHAFGPVLPRQVGANGVQIRAVRFWIPGPDHKTSVMAMVEVPYALSTPVSTGPAAFIAYQVDVFVKNEAGGELTHDRWVRHASAALRAENATGMEQLNFGVVPGKYWLQVQVMDSAAGKIVAVDSIRVDGYASAPPASDLLLTSKMRLAVPGDTSTEVGEVARGNFRFSTSPTLQIDITQPVLGFLMEAYTADSATATLSLKIANADGTDMVQLPSTSKSIPAGGGVFANQIPLDGLPPGKYLLKASLNVKGQVVERQAPFTVNAVEAALARSVTETNANKGLDEVYFNSLPEDSLDAAAEELQLLPDVSARERAPYKKDELSLTGKRRFLIEFWAKRDRNKSTPENEDRMRFYQAVGYANQHFASRFVPGWKTAMGRVYANFGVADDSLPSTMAGRGIRYVVWRMTRGKARWFIFGDRDGTGNYALMRSSETAFPGDPNWYEEITPESAAEIGQWLGLGTGYFRNSH